MDVLISVAQLLLGLSLLVAVHELGHLLAAKYFGMRVEQFSIGFPPKIWSFKKGETEYAVSAIPLGGYVKISGMIDESLDTETMNKPPQPWEFRSKPAWQRLIVMLGGIIVNLIVGVLIFIGLTYFVGDVYFSKDDINRSGLLVAGNLAEEIGLKTGDQILKINGKDFEDYQDVYKPANLIESDASFLVKRGNSEPFTVKIPDNFIENFNKDDSTLVFIKFRFPAEIGEIEKNSLAQRIGLKSGDRLVKFEGKPIKYFDEFSESLSTFQHDSTRASDSVHFTVERKGEMKDYTIDLNDFDLLAGRRTLGFYPSAYRQVDYDLATSLGVGAERAFTTLFTQIKAFGKILRGEISLRKSVSGPIGMVKAYGPKWNWTRFWTITGLLSLMLAFMNLLPIPALDGGHVMFLTFEMVSGRKPSDKFLENAQKVGMVFLLVLMVFIFANDIINLF